MFANLLDGSLLSEDEQEYGQEELGAGEGSNYNDGQSSGRRSLFGIQMGAANQAGATSATKPVA